MSVLNLIIVICFGQFLLFPSLSLDILLNDIEKPGLFYPDGLQQVPVTFSPVGKSVGLFESAYFVPNVIFSLSQMAVTYRLSYSVFELICTSLSYGLLNFLRLVGLMDFLSESYPAFLSYLYQSLTRIFNGVSKSTDVILSIQLY